MGTPGTVNLSPFVLLAILVYFQSIPQSWPSISPDDYHAGESYLPWWLLNAHGYLPFVDYQPSRGLVNYIPGFLSWLFFDNSASGQTMVHLHETALYVLIVFSCLRLRAGDFVAFLASASLILVTTGPVSGTIAAISGLVAVHHVASKVRLVWAFLLWLLLSALLPLFAIAEGGAFALAALPLGIFVLYQALRMPERRRALAMALGVVAVGAALLALATPALRIEIAAARYLLEQSSVNDVAHALAWAYPADLTQRVTSGSLWQFLRFSWLLMIVPVIILLVKAKRGSPSPAEQGGPHWLFLVSLLIMAVILIPRAAGRIDPEFYSRPGWASIPFVFFGLPLVVFPPLPNPGKRLIMLLICALIFGALGDQEAALRRVGGLHHHVLVEPGFTISGKRAGLGGLGTSVVMDSEQRRRQVQLRRVLKQLLAPGETYYDLTNHNADYVFQARPAPVSDTAFHNIPSTKRQTTILAQLDATKPPLALVSAENFIIDGANLPLRAFLIYQYLLEQYVPFADEHGRVWMIRRDAENRLSGTAYSVGNPTQQAQLLQQALGQSGLQGLPAAWGSSMRSLRPKLGDPIDLLAGASVAAVHDLQSAGHGAWLVVGDDPFLVLNMSHAGKYDMLYLQLAWGVEGNSLQVYWTNNLVEQFTDRHSMTFSAASSSAYLIPLSAAPSWELADGLGQLRIDLPEGVGQQVRFDKILLFTRLGPD